MRERFRAWFEHLRESLFFLPGLLIAGSIGLAILAIWFDDRQFSLGIELPLLEVTVASARAILATVATATMTVAGIVFAMTAVTVQLASSTYSPRVIRGFLRDRFQQTVIGASAGTFTFCLVVLATTRVISADAAETASRPSAAVSIALVLGVLTLVSIVGFIDHVVKDMRADEVIRRVTDSTTESVRRFFPSEAEHEEYDEQRMPQSEPTVIAAKRSGWVRAIDIDRIIEVLPAGSVARLDVTIGTFVFDGRKMGRVWCGGEADCASVAELVRRAISVAKTRSIDQDPGYGLRLLVDIALKALSPGINDPTTAVSVVRHLGKPMSEILRREVPPRVIRGEEGRKLYQPNLSDHADYVRDAFREIRIMAENQPEVLEAMIDVMGSLVDEFGERGRSAAIRKQAGLVLDVGATLSEPDRERLERMARKRGLID